MGRAWIGLLPAVGVALSASFAVAGGVQIQHDPVACVPSDRYARIAATAVPAGLVTSALLQFRVDPASAWYSVLMRVEGGEWSAALPRPTKALARFEYRIVMSSPDREEAATAAFPVRVGVADPAECGAAAESSVGSSIVVRVPSGAPVVPPVPPGFSPTGVVAEAGPSKEGSGKKILVGVGLVGVAGGVAAALASKSSSPEPDVPDFVLEGTSPEPGSVLSLSRGTLTLRVRMSREPKTPLTFTWRLEMRDSHRNQLCVVMTDVFVGAQRPPSLLLSAPLTTSGACGQRFDVDSERLAITVDGKVVSDATLGLPFHFEP
jgi:hypothetical protein